MNKKTFSVVIAVLTFVVGVGIARLSLPDRPRKQTRERTEVQLSNYRLSGPYEHENLTIFLIHGPGEPNSRLFTSLQNAMERNLVMVHETSNVNELAIENVSDDEEVLVQAGDIVKGGRQDRALAVDLILPAKSGTIPMDAFCVEHGRWQPREAESADHFTLTEMASSKDLKTAIKNGLSQLRVWEEVGEAQESLGAGLAGDPRDDVSRSSLPLTLENDKVQEAAAVYVNTLSSIIADSNDVLGFIFAIKQAERGGCLSVERNVQAVLGQIIKGCSDRSGRRKTL